MIDIKEKLIYHLFCKRYKEGKNGFCFNLSKITGKRTSYMCHFAKCIGATDTKPPQLEYVCKLNNNKYRDERLEK